MPKRTREYFVGLRPRSPFTIIEPQTNGVTFEDSFSYNYRGRTIAGILYTFSTTYDLPLALTYPGGEVVTTIYDKQVANQLKTSALPSNQFLVSDVTYNHRLEMTGMSLGNNLTQSYVYFGATENYRLDKALLKVNGGSNIYYREYEYDNGGNITQFITSVAGQVQEEQFFTYDSLGRLKTAKAVNGPAPYDHSSASTDYDYDAIGNLVNMAGTSLGYQDSAHKHAATHRNGNPTPSYTYDDNGNMVTRIEGNTTYTQLFDVENRLKTVSLSSSNIVTHFAYDASGQRLRTEVAPTSPSSGNSRTVTTYPFPGYEVEQRYTWQYVCASEENCYWAWAQTATITRKTYFLGGQAIATHINGDPSSGNNGFFYLHSDHLGSSSLLTNSSGVKVTGSETRYYPYGAQRLAPTLPADNITDRDFTGQKENLEIGAIYYNARFYSPSLGRFLTADTVVPDPTAPQSLNRYTYVLGNPISFKDPSGHCSEGHMGDDYEDYDCLKLAQDVAHKYGWSFNELTKYNWEYGRQIPLTSDKDQLAGGDAIIGYELVEFEGRVATVDGYDVYSIHYGDEEIQERALVTYRGDTGLQLQDFKVNAVEHGEAQFDYMQGAYNTSAGTVAFGGGLVISAAGLIPEPASPLLVVAGAVVSGAGFIQTVVGWAQQGDAGDDIYMYSLNAQVAFTALTDSDSPYSAYVLAVDLDSP